jgi:hypothetical protein
MSDGKSSATRCALPELWLPYPKLPDVLEISNYGRARFIHYRKNSTSPDKVSCVSPSSRGYWIIHIRVNGQRKTIRCCRAVLETFWGPPPTPRHQANHIDGNKANDHIDNLEWTTPSENSTHAVATGLIRRSHLTPETVRIMRDHEGKHSAKWVARAFGVSPWTVAQIWRRRTWAWLDG